jgi:hypothetical protein
MTDDLVRSQQNQVLMLYGDPGQMGNWSSRNRVEAFRSMYPIKMPRGGTQQAIDSESLSKGIWRHDLTMDKASHAGSRCQSAEMPALGGTHRCPTVLAAFRAILNSTGKTGT